MILKHAVNSLAVTESAAVNRNCRKTAHIDRNGDSVARKVSVKFIRFRQKINFIAGMQPVARNKKRVAGFEPAFKQFTDFNPEGQYAQPEQVFMKGERCLNNSAVRHTANFMKKFI